ncbi:Spore germination protein A1 [Paenibacillus solanacearum]|uniref:Spore germination protein A1 n=1 Tax=Paenibacillus solanacearum TaxID=2048548 RepID=A0A916NFU3_9BACL|nr:spore germination protein [Paenibacillus solanacearum]CAG7600466.1 Spore germination protein A1 [Paenibacillus solanacearum]
MANGNTLSEGQLADSAASFLRAMKDRLGESADIVYREMKLGPHAVIFVFVEGMGDPRHVIESILKDADWFSDSPVGLSPEACLTFLKERTIALGKVGEVRTYPEMMSQLLCGQTILYIEGARTALSAGTEMLKQRGVEEASSQSVVRGPREGFTESLRENVALVRRRIHNTQLRIEHQKLGLKTGTSVAVMYLEGTVDMAVLQELRRRLNAVKIESVLESNYIEELIQDSRYSPFPTVFNSERPDVIASAVLEGRIAIFVEGTPFVLVVPALFVQFFQSSEDYYQRGDFASFVRLLRYFCFVVALITPAFYIAITTFHQEMIQTTLLMSLIGQREGVPFPSFVEVVIMEVTFEILREAGIRLPKSVGQSVSIVGTLVIGQAAVEAGLVSAAMVIVVSITAISNFALPAFNVGISVRMLRFVLMAVAAAFGLYGIIVSIIMLSLHLCSLQSMGVPYMTSFAPFRWNSQSDALLRIMRRRKKS